VHETEAPGVHFSALLLQFAADTRLAAIIHPAIRFEMSLRFMPRSSASARPSTAPRLLADPRSPGLTNGRHRRRFVVSEVGGESPSPQHQHDERHHETR
jgi:hypothetical protein